MKLLFSIGITFIVQLSWARPIVLIQYDQNRGLAKKVEALSIKRIGIPDFFITMEKVARLPCRPKFESILQICIDNYGRIYFPVLKKDILEKTFLPLIEQEEL